MNWPFFTFTARPVSAAATNRSVCRAKKAGICSSEQTSPTLAACSGQMDVGRRGESSGRLHLPQHFETFVDARPPLRIDAGSIGFVKGRLKDDLHVITPVDRLERVSNLQRQFASLQNAGTGDQHQRLAGATEIRSDRNRIDPGSNRSMSI